MIKKELFAPSLNGIPISCQYVSSTNVTPHPGLNDLSRHAQIERNKETRRTWHAFPKVEHRHGNSVASFYYAHVNKSISIYVAIHEQRAPINMLSRSKTPKTHQVEGFTDMRIASDSFVAFDQDGTFAPVKTLVIYILVPVKSIIAWNVHRVAEDITSPTYQTW